MTRKGLAFGAAATMVLSVLSAQPANANGLFVANYVSLLPSSGSVYATLSSEAFDLRSNVVGSLQGTPDRDLKFRVTDPDKLLAVDVDTTAITAATEVTVTDAETLTQASVVTKTASQNLAVFTVTAHGLVTGDSIEVTTAATAGVPLGIYVVTRIGADTFSIDTGADTALVTTQAPVIKTASPQKSGSTVTIHDRAHGLEVGDAVNVTTAATAGLAAGYYTVASVPSANRFTLTAADTTALTLTQRPVVKYGDQDDLDSRELLAKVAKVSSTAHFGTSSIASGTGITDGRTADGSFVVNTETNSNSVNRTLRLVNTDATKTTTVTVTAWVDDNDDNAIDPTEYVSETRSITFYKTSDLTVTTALTTPVIGDSSINGTISITPALNGEQIRTTATAGVYVVPTVQAGIASVTSVTWNPTTKVWDIVLGDSNGVEVGTFTARAEIADAATGNTASVLVRSRTAADTRLAAAAGADQTGWTNKRADVVTNTGKVRTGKSATLVVTAYDADQDTAGTAVVAGVTVNVVLSNATTTTDWSINGTKVLDNESGKTLQYTTNAQGQVTLVVASTSGVNGDTITVEARPEGLTTTAAAAATVTYETAAYDLVDLNAPANGAARNVVKGGSVTFDIAAVDQYGQLMTGDYRLQMAKSGQSDGTDIVAFNSGRASYTVADQALTTGGTIGVATQLQKLTSGSWANSTDATDLADVTITVISAPTTSIVPVTTYSSGTTFDLVTSQIVEFSSELGTATQVTLETNTASIGLGAGTGLAVGDIVTVSGAGLWFSYNDGGTIKVTKKDSLTFVLDSVADTIRVHSNVYFKDAVVTLAANGRSGTTKVTSAKAGPDSGTNITWNAPTSVSPGSTFQVTGTLKDAFGNVVDATNNDVRVSYSGPGIVFGTLPTDTNANGEFSFAVLLGTNDRGTATITFEYDLDGDGVMTDDVNNFTTTKTVTVGAAASAQSTSVKRTGNTVDVRVTGYAKSRIVLNGVRVASRSTLGTLSRTLNLRAGRNVIQIVVDGTVIRTVRYTR